MDADESAYREAVHKAASLHNLGWETGAGATVWARAIQDAADMHESARERFATDTADSALLRVDLGHTPLALLLRFNQRSQPGTRVHDESMPQIVVRRDNPDSRESCY